MATTRSCNLRARRRLRLRCARAGPMGRRWPRDAGLGLDYLLLSPVITPRLCAAGVDRWCRGEPDACDHVPAWVDLNLDREVACSLDATFGGWRQRHDPVRFGVVQERRVVEPFEHQIEHIVAPEDPVFDQEARHSIDAVRHGML